MCSHACNTCVSASDRGVEGLFFFDPPVKCFTLAAAWKGSLIEKLSGRGICHPPRCSVTTLIHAQPDHNREASHSTSQREGGPLHSRGVRKGGTREGEREREETRPVLINNPLDFTYLRQHKSIIQSHVSACFVFHLDVGVSGSCLPGIECH